MVYLHFKFKLIQLSEIRKLEYTRKKKLFWKVYLSRIHKKRTPSDWFLAIFGDTHLALASALVNLQINMELVNIGGSWANSKYFQPSFFFVTLNFFGFLLRSNDKRETNYHIQGRENWRISHWISNNNYRGCRNCFDSDIGCFCPSAFQEEEKPRRDVIDGWKLVFYYV